MHSQLEHLQRLTAEAAPNRLAGPRSLAWIRALLAVKALLIFALMALLHERPDVMLVGLAPLALLAAEAAWHLPDGLVRRDGDR